MTKSIIYLDAEEEKALRLFAESKSSREVYDLCEIPYIGIHFFTSNIRRKTGISDILYPQECRSYLEKYHRAMNPRIPLTSDEAFAIRLLTEKKNTYLGVSKRMGWGVQQADDIFENARKKMAIFSDDDATRRLQFRLYLAIFHTQGMKMMHEKQAAALRLAADNLPYSEIGDQLGITRELAALHVKEGAAKLGLNTRGRNTQRVLIRAFIEHVDSEAEKAADALNDPMF